MSDQFPRRPKPVVVDFDPSELKRYLPTALLVAAGLLVAYGIGTSVYTVQPEEEAVVKRFGKVVGMNGPGLHFKVPFGIETATLLPTSRVLKEEFGFRTSSVSGGRTEYSKTRESREESLMLTGDLKVIDVEWVVQYRISDPDLYLHQVREPSKTLRDISEAVMRRIVGNSLGSDVLTERRVQVATAAREELQAFLDEFRSGIRISTIELQDVTPPDSVKPAFNEVNQAEQERERLINEAEKRRNQVIPRAEGQAKQIIAEAEGYSAQRVNRAQGEVARFNAIRTEYANDPEVTRRRMYLETIDAVLPTLGRVFVMDESGTSPLPLLNLSAEANPLPTAK